jgi:hypothetical protein
MKLRHKETGEVINLPDYLPEYEDAKEIARVFQEAAGLEDHDLPRGIVSLKTFSGDIIQVAKIINGNPHFPYDKLIRIHLHLPPFTNIEQQNKSTVWTVHANGTDWSVGSKIFDFIIQKLEWVKGSGWWAITDGIYAIQLNKITSELDLVDNNKSSQPEDSESNRSDSPPILSSVLQ